MAREKITPEEKRAREVHDVKMKAFKSVWTLAMLIFVGLCGGLVWSFFTQGEKVDYSSYQEILGVFSSLLFNLIGKL